MLSIIIPARNELFLQQTIDSLLENSMDEIEVIPILDGYWPNPPLKDDPRVHIIHRGQARGMRAAVNAGATIAKGRYLMKCDAHCMFGPKYDHILTQNCEDNWLVIPSRYSLDAENWKILETGKSRVDYHFMTYPYWHPGEPGLHGKQWNERARERAGKPEYDIDDEMSFQGSCWFTTSGHFKKRVGWLQEEGYGTFIGEPQEIGLKTWLGGGRCVVNKKTWYAHLHKGKQYGRMYFMDKRECIKGNEYSYKYWMNNSWPKRIHDIDWLIEKFWPVPTWPENWKGEYQKMLEQNG